MEDPLSARSTDAGGNDDRYAAVNDPLDDRAAARWAWTFTLVGIVIRLVRYGLRMPLWNDEAFLALNVIRRDYAGLTEGLDTTQVAPIGYLWTSRAAIEWLGTSEFTLRLPALAAGIVALLAFHRLAATALRGTAQVAAVACFAVAYYPYRHAVEVKPYACDLAAAVLLLAAGVACRRRPSPARLLGLGAMFALCLPFSYPAVFVAGGVGLALAIEVVPRRRFAETAALVAAGLALVATFGGLYLAAMSGQWNRTGGNMQWHWNEGFPPSPTEPLALVAWLVKAHTGETLAYPAGGDAPWGLPQAMAAAIGVVALVRSKQTFLVRAVAGMLALALLAAVLRRYPYGFGERVNQHWVPGVCLLLGAGGAELLARIRSPRRRNRPARLAVGLLLGLAVALPTIDFAKPYKYRFDRDHQEFARWFWRFAGEGRPLVCLGRDLGRKLFDPFSEIQYHVQRSIYRRVPYDGGGAAFDSIPRGAPITCVIGTYEHYPPSAQALAGWLGAMNRVYLPPHATTYVVRNDRDLSIVYHVWKFEPRTPEAHLSQVVLPPAEEWAGTKPDAE